MHGSRSGEGADPIKACFDASYRRLVGQLYGVCGDLAEAEDAVGEAFARAIARRRSFEQLDNPEAWLRTVAVNVARSRYRRRRIGDRLLGREASSATPSDRSADRLAVVTALRELPAGQREAIALHYLGDLSLADVAATLGVPVGTVKARLSRGRIALAEILNSHDEEGVGGRRG